MQRWLLTIAGVATGLLLILASAYFGHKDHEWLASTLGNVGVTVLLAAPLAEYLRHVNADVQSVARKVDEVDRLLHADRRATDSDRARALAEDLLKDREDARERAASGMISTVRQLVGVIAVASDEAIISRFYGLEMIDFGTQLKFRFTCGVMAITTSIYDSYLGVEVRRSQALRPDCSIAIDRAKDLADNMGVLLAAVKSNLDVDYEPMLPVELLRRSLRQLANIRETHPDVGPVQQIIDDNWIIGESQLIHLPSRSAVPLATLRDASAADLERQPWVHDLSATDAIRIARTKVGRQSAFHSLTHAPYRELGTGSSRQR